MDAMYMMLEEIMEQPGVTPTMLLTSVFGGSISVFPVSLFATTSSLTRKFRTYTDIFMPRRNRGKRIKAIG
jgi:hypothetical protein